MIFFKNSKNTTNVRDIWCAFDANTIIQVEVWEASLVNGWISLNKVDVKVKNILCNCNTILIYIVVF